MTDLTGFSKIIESDDVAFINKKLTEGWKLITTASGVLDEEGQPNILYSIGWDCTDDPS